MRSLEGFGEIIVGDGTHGVYGRFEAIAQAKFDIVKYVIDVKMAERDSAAEASEKAAKKQKLLAKLAEKQEQKLDTLSEDEVREMDEKELASLVKKHSLKIDLAKYPKLGKKIAAVIDALEKPEMSNQPNLTAPPEKPGCVTTTKTPIVSIVGGVQFPVVA
jgi:hypothetical protein